RSQLFDELTQLEFLGRLSSQQSLSEKAHQAGFQEWFAVGPAHGDQTRPAMPHHLECGVDVSGDSEPMCEVVVGARGKDAQGVPRVQKLARDGADRAIASRNDHLSPAAQELSDPESLAVLDVMKTVQRRPDLGHDLRSHGAGAEVDQQQAPKRSLAGGPHAVRLLRIAGAGALAGSAASAPAARERRPTSRGRAGPRPTRRWANGPPPRRARAR